MCGTSIVLMAYGSCLEHEWWSRRAVVIPTPDALALGVLCVPLLALSEIRLLVMCWAKRRASRQVAYAEGRDGCNATLHRPYRAHHLHGPFSCCAGGDQDLYS